jgi:geranylgeranyl pyrophosphate synthase
MDQKKTGDLFACSLEFGAIIANAAPSIEEHLHQAGLHLGLAYQIRDDLEDATTAISDNAKQNKPTFTTLLGPEPTRKFLLQTLEKLNHHLSFLPSGAPMIKGFIDPLFDTKIDP